MIYTVLKPFCTKGKRHHIGDVIGESYIEPNSAPRLVRCGYIAELSNDSIQEGERQLPISSIQTQNTDPLINIPIMTDTGILEANMEPQSIITAFTIMQKNVEEATRDIAELEDMDTLILLNAADSRKGIQKAAEERNAQLHKMQEDKLGNKDEKEGNA